MSQAARLAPSLLLAGRIWCRLCAMPCAGNHSLVLAPHFSLHRRQVLCWCLQEGGVVIPAGAVVFGQLVESPILQKCSVSTSGWLLAPCLLICLMRQGLAAIVCNRIWQAQRPGHCHNPRPVVCCFNNTSFCLTHPSPQTGLMPQAQMVSAGPSSWCRAGGPCSVCSADIQHNLPGLSCPACVAAVPRPPEVAQCPLPTPHAGFQSPTYLRHAPALPPGDSVGLTEQTLLHVAGGLHFQHQHARRCWKPPDQCCYSLLSLVILAGDLEGRAACSRPAVAPAAQTLRAPMSCLQVQATAAGTVDACIISWVLLMDQEGCIRISTAPDWVAAKPGSRRKDQMPQAWRDHWKQCWAPVPARPEVACGHNLQV